MEGHAGVGEAARLEAAAGGVSGRGVVKREDHSVVMEGGRNCGGGGGGAAVKEEGKGEEKEKRGGHFGKCHSSRSMKSEKGEKKVLVEKLLE